MKTIINQLIAILLLIPLYAYANTEHNYWQCAAEDNSHYQWTMSGQYEREAINKAYEACKKQSQNPRTCKSTATLCDYFRDGHSTKPIWQCTALDQTAAAWESNPDTNRNDAALAAKAYCQSKSTLPASCYINLLTCRNLNEQ